MAHNIAKDARTGQDARFLAVVNGVKPIWEGLGQVVSEAKTAEEALKLSHLDFTLADAPIYTQWTASGPRKIETHKAIVRMDTKDTIAVVGKNFGTVQPVECFRFLDSLIEDDSAHYISAGLLNSAIMFVLMEVPAAGFEVTAGDKHESYMMLAQGFGGQMQFTAMLTDTRVECQNTMMQALSGAGEKLNLKHTRHIKARLDSAHSLIQATIQDSKTLAEKLRQMAKVRMTKASMVSVLDRLFPKNEEAKVQTKRDNILSEVLGLYESNDKDAFPVQRGTAYNLLNAVTQYTDHFRSSKANGNSAEYKRAESAMFGSGERLKAEAFDVIYQLVDGTSETRTETRFRAETDAELLESIIS